MNGNAARIYRGGIPSNEPPRPRRTDSGGVQTTVIATPVVSILRSSEPATSPPKAQTIGPSLEQRITDIIQEAPPPAETLEMTFRRKEQALREVFSTLSVVESRALHRRLTLASSTDPLVKTFGRLVAGRRERLLAFLADVRRREAIAGARKVER
jgi:hypothetical protein